MNAAAPDATRRPRVRLPQLPKIESASDLVSHVPLAIAVVIVGATAFALRPPLSSVGSGLANGSVYGLTAVAIILVHRTHRIINFAAAAVGAVPGVLAALLVSGNGLPFLLGLALAAIGGAALGAGCDVVVVRRFASSSRLVLTVATLGLAQLLAFVAIYVPIWLGNSNTQAAVVSTPFDGFVLHGFGTKLLTGGQIFAVLVAIALCVGLGAFFRFSRLGIATRAAAENADRALLLGVPVRVVQTIAWAVAGLFAGTTIMLRSTLVGIPFDGSLGYSVLLYCLAAAVLARMERIGVALVAGLFIGLLEQGAYINTGKPDVTNAIMLGLIIVALLVQRQELSRAVTGSLSGGSGGDGRGIPAVMAKLPEVVALRIGTVVAVAAVAIGAPYVVSPEKVGRLTLVPISALVALSLVVLTGWAGQISLGQFGLVGVGAAITTGLAADHNLDATVVLAAGILGGVVAAILIGLPAVRSQGLYLAVTTLSFAGAAETWILKKGFPIADVLLPGDENARIRRPQLWQRIDLTSDKALYFVSVVVLVAATLTVARFRSSRAGRVLVSTRDNPRAAPAYGIDVRRTRLVAFAISGGIAAMAGVLLAYQQQQFDAASYGVVPSVEVFTAAVIGGVGSLGGALFGAVLVGVVKQFGGDKLTLLVTGPGLLLVLWLRPGGLGSLGVQARDAYLRWAARRHGLDVPSLNADRRTPTSGEEPGDPTATVAVDETPLEAAGHHIDDVHVPADHLVCPVCGDAIPIAAALDHEHFRQPAVPVDA